MVAILAVVCPRQILFWLSGVAGVDVPQGVLLWSDGLIGAATAIVMTGGQMYLVHHLTTLVLTAEITLWRRLLVAVLGLTCSRSSSRPGSPPSFPPGSSASPPSPPSS